MSRSIFKRVIPLVVVAVMSAFVYYGCVELPVDPGEEEETYTPDIPTNGKSVAELLKDGHKALKDKDYDVALAYYEAAYKENGSDSKAITYSTLAKVAKISIEPDVVNLFRNRFGFKDYPNELNALLSSDWWESYPSEYWEWDYYDPKNDRYVYWLDTWYVNSNEYPEVTKVGYHYSTWGYVLASTNPRYEADGSIEDWYYDEDLDEYVSWYDEDDVESGYYEGIDSEGYYYHSYTYTFVTATKRNREVDDMLFPGLEVPVWLKGKSSSIYSGTLVDGAPGAETWPILLLANLLDKNTNGLNGLLDETIAGVFGNSFNEACARVDKLKGKGAITLDEEFLQALNLGNLVDEYDKIGWMELNAYLSFMTAIKASLEWIASYDWNTNLNFLKFAWGTEEDFYNSFKSIDAKDLPFNNNFLKARPGKMAAAKADFIKAIEGLKASYGAIADSDDDFYPTEVKDAYPTLSSGADRLIAAIQNGGKFYIPDDATKGNWPTSGKNGIDMGKLFEEGYFSLPNLFETSSSGKPVFYADGKQLTPTSNYVSQIDNAGYAALRFKTKRVTDVIIGFESDASSYDVQFPPKYGKLLFEKYYGVSSQSKARIAPLAKARLRE